MQVERARESFEVAVIGLSQKIGDPGECRSFKKVRKGSQDFFERLDQKHPKNRPFIQQKTSKTVAE